MSSATRTRLTGSSSPRWAALMLYGSSARWWLVEVTALCSAVSDSEELGWRLLDD
ncbi:hypothetical protein [Halarchaeum acidiphilum]|uniref:hypothetical protein n=1 Tax=Halarchaeum acidiphilum TaxID=489138 RepID=UPI0003745A52|nr:hypothetical protein [Halarchaeum acidiphilum]